MTKITHDEYRQRAASLQAAMEVEGLDALLVYSWKRGLVRYVSGYHPNFVANQAVLVLPRQGTPALRIRFPFDLARAHRESWIDDIRASGSPAQMVNEAAGVIQARGLAQGRIGLATGDNVINELPYTLYSILQSALPDAALPDARQLLLQARRIKSQAEFDLLRAAAQLADVGAEAAHQALAPGLSDFEIVAAAESAMRSRGAEMHLVAISSKGMHEPIGPPQDRIIEAGDNVILEVAVQKSGYTAQAARAFLRRRPLSWAVARFIGQPTRLTRQGWSLPGPVTVAPGWRKPCSQSWTVTDWASTWKWIWVMASGSICPSRRASKARTILCSSRVWCWSFILRCASLLWAALSWGVLH